MLVVGTALRARGVLAVVRAMARQGLALARSGAIIGLLAALAPARPPEGPRYDASARNSVIFAAVLVVLALVAVLATRVPVRGGGGPDPGAARRVRWGWR